MGADDGRHHLIGIEGDRRQRPQQRAFAPEAVRGPLAGRLVDAHVGHTVAPPGRQSQVVFEADQFVGTPGQGVVLDVAHAPLDDPFGFRIAPLAGDRLHAEVAAQRQELGMETRGPA